MTNPGMERLIDNNNCLPALAELRRAKWFQQCATQVPSCIPTIRIFRDLSQVLSLFAATSLISISAYSNMGYSNGLATTFAYPEEFGIVPRPDASF
jgi:uncharacterized membrane protein